MRNVRMHSNIDALRGEPVYRFKQELKWGVPGLELSQIYSFKKLLSV